MAFDFDKCTSWCDPCIDVIIDLDPYINIIWVQVELDHCIDIVNMKFQ